MTLTYKERAANQMSGAFNVPTMHLLLRPVRLIHFPLSLCLIV